MLVVDDNVDAAEMLGMVLELHGHSVAMAHDGIEALHRARDLRPDVVVLDIGLPGASGYEVARAIRAEPALASVRLVAVTGYGRDEDRRALPRCGLRPAPREAARAAQLLQGISRQLN